MGVAAYAIYARGKVRETLLRTMKSDRSRFDIVGVGLPAHRVKCGKHFYEHTVKCGKHFYEQCSQIDHGLISSGSGSRCLLGW